MTIIDIGAVIPPGSEVATFRGFAPRCLWHPRGPSCDALRLFTRAEAPPEARVASRCPPHLVMPRLLTSGTRLGTYVIVAPLTHTA